MTMLSAMDDRDGLVEEGALVGSTKAWDTTLSCKEASNKQMTLFMVNVMDVMGVPMGA